MTNLETRYLSEIVQDRIEELGLTVHALAEAPELEGITLSTIYRFLRGGNPQWENVEPLLRALGLDVVVACDPEWLE